LEFGALELGEHCQPRDEDAGGGRSFPLNCDLPHTWTAENMRAPSHEAQSGAERMLMRTSIAIAVLVALGLIWSIAAMSNWVPVDSAQMRSSAISPHVVTVRQDESVAAE
jgi:hypothetical protein